MKQVLFIALIGAFLVPGSAEAGLVVGDPEGVGLQVYGFTRLDVIFQDSHLSHPQYPEFAPHLPEGEEGVGDFTIHPRLSRLGFKTWSRDVADGVSLETRIEIDFQNGGSESRSLIRMRHAYGKLQAGGFSLLAGQTWQLVSQLYPGANADSMMWNAGNTGDRSPQIRLAYDFAAGQEGSFQTALAVQMPNTVDGADRDEDGFKDGAVAQMPSLEARMAYQRPLWTSLPFRMAIGGHYGEEAHDLSGDTATDDDGFTTWGLFTELELPLHDVLSIRGEFFLGEGLSDFRGGVKQTVDGDGGSVETMGFWGEAVIRPLSVLKLVAGYGQDDPEVGELGIDKNSVLWAAVHWTVVPSMKVGAEYHRWSTEHAGDSEPASSTAAVSRFNVHFKYAF